MKCAALGFCEVMSNHSPKLNLMVCAYCQWFHDQNEKNIKVSPLFNNLHITMTNPTPFFEKFALSTLLHLDDQLHQMQGVNFIFGQTLDNIISSCHLTAIWPRGGRLTFFSEILAFGLWRGEFCTLVIRGAINDQISTDTNVSVSFARLNYSEV